jgi:3-deoxy-D-manno-octulosonate 8-phosphate phosphatase KdsC-like HAD superfamily phosphatase
MYENGAAKLYYSLQRKMSEMSKIFNSQDLSAIDMASKSDATFERVFKLLEKCEIVSKSAESLGAIAGVTGNEKKDVERRPFIETVATKRD